MADKKMPPWLNKKKGEDDEDEDEKKDGKGKDKKKMTPAERLKMFRENRKSFGKKK
jgi:hypothetical protein